MDQILTGSFIAKKRKQKNMTQAALAEKLGISSKTISKWETGKCMPDYSIIEPLCKELGITTAELLEGKEITDNSACTDTQMLSLMKRIQSLENQRTELHGFLLMLMGMALLLLHFNVGGSNIRDFFSGVLLGLAIAEMLLGVYISAKGFTKQP